MDFEAKDCVKAKVFRGPIWLAQLPWRVCSEAMDSLGCLKEGTDFKADCQPYERAQPSSQISLSQAVEGVVQKNFETGKALGEAAGMRYWKR